MTRYRRKASVEAAPLGAETMLYDPGARRFCQLNATAACVWEQLERPSTAGEISEVVRGRFTAGPNAQVEADVAEAIRMLMGLELIESTSDQRQAPHPASRTPQPGGQR